MCIPLQLFVSPIMNGKGERLTAMQAQSSLESRLRILLP
jgi:hypothetical protein